ncbi:rhodanese-like domain-containing protein [Chloroflexota bacterium]
MKRKNLLMLIPLVALVIVCVLTAGCAVQTIEDITPQDAADLIEENLDNSNFVIIDVRTPAEFTSGHIDNAINIDFSSENFEIEINHLDKSKTYLIHCQSGNRSRGALDVMVEMGFREVYHLSVGISGWLAEGFPITK